MNTVFDHYNFQVFIQSHSPDTQLMTTIEAPVVLEAPPAPKIPKRNVKAAAKSEKAAKKVAKSKSKGRKFALTKCANKKHTH